MVAQPEWSPERTAEHTDDVPVEVGASFILRTASGSYYKLDAVDFEDGFLNVKWNQLVSARAEAPRPPDTLRDAILVYSGGHPRVTLGSPLELVGMNDAGDRVVLRTSAVEEVLRVERAPFDHAA